MMRFLWPFTPPAETDQLPPPPTRISRGGVFSGFIPSADVAVTHYASEVNRLRTALYEVYREAAKAEPSSPTLKHVARLAYAALEGTDRA